MNGKTPITTLSRSKTLLKGAFTIGSKKTKQFAKKAFLSKEEYSKEAKKIESEIATALFENIALLKGTAVKIAQAFVLHNILPKTIQEELAKSYNQITPINKALVIKIIKQEHGKEPSKLFKEFDLTPFASASLGQVHKVTTYSNETLAIKIQYPGIDKTVQSDIKLIKRLIGYKKNIQRVINEVEKRLQEEIDYKQEMQNTIWAYNNLQNSDIIIPKVYKEYSTKHILATSYIQGKDLYSWLQTNPPQESKNKIANIIFENFIDSIFKHHTIQADPNPANYIITPNNQVALIDFGCLKHFTKEFIDNYISLLRNYRSNNKEEILKIYKQIGFIKDPQDINDKIFTTKILPFNKWAIEPFVHEEYTFTKEYLDQGVQFANIFLNKPFLVVEDFIFLDRLTHGLFSLFEQMHATINMQKIREIINLK